MFTSTMFIIPGTSIYVFMGVFNNFPKCKYIPVVDHFRPFLPASLFKNLVVKYHTYVTGINKKIFKIGFYRIKDKNSGTKGAGTSTNSGTIEMPRIISMPKRA